MPRVQPVEGLSDEMSRSDKLGLELDDHFRCFLIERSLFMTDLDPFEIYKDPEARRRVESRTDFCLSCASSTRTTSSLRLEFTDHDRKRSRFALYNGIFHIYLMLKSFLVFAIQFLLFRHELCDKATTGTTGTNGSSEQSKQADCSEPPFDYARLQRIGNFIGNPYAVLGESSSHLYIGLMGLAITRLIAFPLYHHKRRKLDMASLRFLLRPRLEQRRLDAVARRKLLDIQMSMSHSLENRIKSLEGAMARARATNSQAVAVVMTRGAPGIRISDVDGCDLLKRPNRVGVAALGLSMREDCAIISGHVRALSEPAALMSSLRPRVYQLEWHSFMKRRVRALAHLLLATLSILALITSLVVAYSNLKAHQKCYEQPTLQQQQRNYTAIIRPGLSRVPSDDTKCRRFTLSDSILFLEVSYCLFFCALYESNHLVLCGASIIMQTQLINSTRLDLLRGGRELMTGQYKRLAIAHEARLRGETINESKWRRMSVQRDRLLLQLVAKLFVVERELADGFRAIALQAIVYLYHGANTILLLFLANGKRTVLSVRMRHALLVLLWVWINSIALLCCSLRARVNQLEKQLWSMMACIGSIQMQDETAVLASRPGAWAQLGPESSNHELRMLSVIGEIWRKYVLTTSGNSRQYCVRSLGVSLTYQRLIELNFMAIFIYSLTWNRANH